MVILILLVYVVRNICREAQLKRRPTRARCWSRFPDNLKHSKPQPRSLDRQEQTPLLLSRGLPQDMNYDVQWLALLIVCTTRMLYRLYFIPLRLDCSRLVGRCPSYWITSKGFDVCSNALILASSSAFFSFAASSSTFSF